MQAQPTIRTTMIAGAFASVAQANRAVSKLREAGFADEQIGVACSGNCHDANFPDVAEAKLKAESAPGSGIAAGTAIGGAIGGLALVAVAVIPGGAPLAAAGTVLIGGGALAGGFAGLMSTLGLDRDKVRKCEHLIAEGKILVAAQAPPPTNIASLTEAQKILQEAGASDLVWLPEKV